MSILEGREKPKRLKSSLLKLTLISLCAIGMVGCDKDSETTSSSTEKALANQYQYQDRGLNDIRNEDYRPIQTKGLIDEELREFYQNASNNKHDYSLDLLISELVTAGLADSYIVRNISVIEGDLFTAQTEDGKRISVRMLGIDAPNKNADFYKESSEALSKCIGNQREAMLLVPKKFASDSLGRVTAQVVVGNKLCNLEQLKTGMAWFYRPMVRHQFDFEISSFNIAESTAKLNKIGLWSKANYAFNKPWLGNERGGFPYQ